MDIVLGQNSTGSGASSSGNDYRERLFSDTFDRTLAHVLLARDCVEIDVRSRNTISPLFALERVMATETSEAFVLSKLIGGIKVLLGFERYNQVGLLLREFRTTPWIHRPLLDVVNADRRLPRYPLMRDRLIIDQDIPSVTQDSHLDVVSGAPDLESTHPIPPLLRVLVLGSFCPGMRKLLQRYYDGEAAPRDKLDRDEALHPTERVICLKELLEERGHGVLLGTASFGQRPSLWDRLAGLLVKADYIIALLSNTGGIVSEATMIVERGFSRKAIFFLAQGTALSGLLKQGLLVLPDVKALQYDSDGELFDLAVRCADAYFEAQRARSG